MVRHIQELDSLVAVLALKPSLLQNLLHAPVQLSYSRIEDLAVNASVLSAELVLKARKTELGLAILALTWLNHKLFAYLAAE